MPGPEWERQPNTHLHYSLGLRSALLFSECVVQLAARRRRRWLWSLEERHEGQDARNGCQSEARLRFGLATWSANLACPQPEAASCSDAVTGTSSRDRWESTSCVDTGTSRVCPAWSTTARGEATYGAHGIRWNCSQNGAASLADDMSGHLSALRGAEADN